MAACSTGRGKGLGERVGARFCIAFGICVGRGKGEDVRHGLTRAHDALTMPSSIEHRGSSIRSARHFPKQVCRVGPSPYRAGHYKQKNSRPDSPLGLTVCEELRMGELRDAKCGTARTSACPVRVRVGRRTGVGCLFPGWLIYPSMGLTLRVRATACTTKRFSTSARRRARCDVILQPRTRLKRNKLYSYTTELYSWQSQRARRSEHELCELTALPRALTWQL
jgi:hypothetical protein